MRFWIVGETVNLFYFIPWNISEHLSCVGNKSISILLLPGQCVYMLARYSSLISSVPYFTYRIIHQVGLICVH